MEVVHARLAAREGAKGRAEELIHHFKLLLGRLHGLVTLGASWLLLLGVLAELHLGSGGRCLLLLLLRSIIFGRLFIFVEFLAGLRLCLEMRLLESAWLFGAATP